MTLASMLKTSTARVARTVIGATLGLGLVISLLGAPGEAFARQVEATPPAARVVVPAEGRGPALWVIRDADSTLYLFGTVHVLRPDTAWGSATVDAAFDSADQVIFEISNPDDSAALQPLIRQYGVSQDRPLSSLLSAEELADLDVAAREIGASAAQFDPLRPWLVGLSLSVAPLVRAGYDPQSGVELILKARAVAAGKPVSGFETIDKQVLMLANLSEETQLDFLRSTLKDFDAATTELDQLVWAWATGDVDTIQRLGVDEMREQSQEIYDALLVRRNADFADQIQTLLAGSGTAFIAVGAAHLAGPDGVPEVLERRGVEIERE